MAGQTFYITRHGLATHTKYVGDEYITADVLPEGRPAVERMARYLASLDIQFESFVCSPVPRTLTTAKIIGQHLGQQPQIEKRIREEYEETFVGFSERVKDFYLEMVEKEYGNVLLTTHGAVISALKNIMEYGENILERRYEFPPVASLWVFREGKLIEEKTF